MIEIDGSHGEGGGQIVRTALALSLATGEPLHLVNARAGRKRPGLLRQHRTAVRAAAEIGGATVRGDDLGSREVFFNPGRLRPGDYHFAVGTAGSATLVLQTILPALLTAGGPSKIVVEGGTHNPMAPPFEFLDRCFLPVLARTGAEVTARLDRHGFFPAGGGRLQVEIHPVSKLTPFALLERSAMRGRRATVLLARLPRHIATRELAIVSKKLGFARKETEVVEIEDSAGPGNALLIELRSDGVTEVVTGFGERSIRAEAVAEKTVRDARRYLASSAPVGEHLADQLLLPLALAGGGTFRTLSPTRHAVTNAEVIQRFLPVRITWTDERDGTVVVELR